MCSVYIFCIGWSSRVDYIFTCKNYTHITYYNVKFTFLNYSNYNNSFKYLKLTLISIYHLN